MKVKELISQLQTMPPDAKVFLDTHTDWQHIDCDNVNLQRDGTVKISSDDPSAEEEAD